MLHTLIRQELAAIQEKSVANRILSCLDKSSEVFVLVDENHHYLFANLAWQKLHKIDRDSVVGRPIWETTHDGHYDGCREAILEAFDVGHYNGLVYLPNATIQAEMTATGKKGERCYLGYGRPVGTILKAA